ncbi:hypothetical protein Pmar_PMAR009207 [Perkinsus marinus ATCC 50983]|uniref:Uncharacterized protein n=1 Tax=Perkinsus marinus (strain ATCC 50983 / TXsc) TaxID=423536 RepID=C5LE30_PERM5|nr:hypothetical protein Pmar_PMAR009207 [Perkinsus marinus ATCC 50983]EER05028.1 hypothetical protein Pmar_PMAR009207 [Perkinsus marinus ATCC 50983]|eukprot:XP_002773212.1 hypothetical protein Pmar_PMAR009207 [Perkinsus marinus ATCC 50983]
MVDRDCVVRNSESDFGEAPRYGGRKGKGRKGSGKGYRGGYGSWDYYDGYYYYVPVGKGKGWSTMGGYYYPPYGKGKGKGKEYGKGAPRVRYWW